MAGWYACNLENLANLPSATDVKQGHLKNERLPDRMTPAAASRISPPSYSPQRAQMQHEIQLACRVRGCRFGHLRSAPPPTAAKVPSFRHLAWILSPSAGNDLFTILLHPRGRLEILVLR